MRTLARLDRALDVAREAAAGAGATAQAYFRRDPAVEMKPDRSPVTKADREADALIVGMIREAFPDHDVLSEEGGALGSGTSDFRWIVDPIDGTRGFIRGDPTWGPMVALEHLGEIVVAVMGLPVFGDLYWATRGTGCFRNGERIHVSSVDRWPEATVTIGFLRGLLREPFGAGVLELLESADRVRCPGDLAGCAAVLEGRADAWLEAGVREWDIAAPRLLLEEAGGRFTDFLGRKSHASGTAIGSNGRLHHDILAALRGS